MWRGHPEDSVSRGFRVLPTEMTGAAGVGKKALGFERSKQEHPLVRGNHHAHYIPDWKTV